MSDALILAFGIVFILEGLAIALAPSILEELIDFLRSLKPQMFHIIGTVSVIIGTALILWVWP